MVGLSVGEKQFMHGGIAQDLRSDGRQRLHFRPISVQTGVIPQANGSARVTLGATDVIVNIKAELGKPVPLRPDKGKVAIFVDTSPTAAPVFEGRGGEELSAELSVVLQRCLLGDKSGAGTCWHTWKSYPTPPLTSISSQIILDFSFFVWIIGAEEKYEINV